MQLIFTEIRQNQPMVGITELFCLNLVGLYTRVVVLLCVFGMK